MEVMLGGTCGRRHYLEPPTPRGRASWGGLFAENPERTVAELLGIALALLGKLNDCLGDRCRQRVSAINQSKPGQCGLECPGQVGNVFWTKRVVVFEDRPDSHVQPYNHTPHVKGSTFYIGSVCDGRRIRCGKSNWDRRRELRTVSSWAIKQKPRRVAGAGS